jgi:hypothetical protein
VRRADSTEVIGNALVAKAQGSGVRTVAARFDRPESTVRRWFRGAGERHAQWLYRRAVDRAVAIDRELLVNPAPEPTTLGHALNLLIGAAYRVRDRFGSGRVVVVVGRHLRRRPADPGRAVAAAFLISGCCRVEGCPRTAVTVTTKGSGPTIGIRQCADRAVTMTTNSPIAVVKQRESIVVRLSDGQHG